MFKRQKTSVVTMLWTGVAIAGLAGCGGGGGGASDLTLTVTQPQAVHAEVYEGQKVPEVDIAGTLSGDISQLSGKTLYLFAVVPDPLFDATPAFNLNSDNRTGTFQMFGVAAPDGSRTYANNITVRACLDAKCENEISAVNARIPYTIVVKPGLHVSADSISLDTTFGTAPAPVTVSLDIPPGATWRLATPSYYGAWGLIDATPASTGTPAIVFTTKELAAPGTTYDADVTVETTTTDGVTLYKTVHVSSTTGASTVAAAFDTPFAAFTLQQGSPIVPDPKDAGILTPGLDSDHIQYLDTAYAWPASAENNSARDSWLWFNAIDEQSSPRVGKSQYSANVSVQGCYPECLPTGHYTAVIRYRYSPAGAAPSILSFPVTLDIMP